VTAGASAGLTLDTGALLALDHPGKAIAMQARLDETLRRGGGVCVPVGTIAQAWRSARQVRLARLLKSRDVDIAVITPNVARSIGLMCARCGHDDVIDVHVALCARERHHIVVTSDPGDMSRIDPALPVIRALPGGVASPPPPHAEQAMSRRRI
jgi:predicted nucleic acid-binding protein